MTCMATNVRRAKTFPPAVLHWAYRHNLYWRLEALIHHFFSCVNAPRGLKKRDRRSSTNKHFLRIHDLAQLLPDYTVDEANLNLILYTDSLMKPTEAIKSKCFSKNWLLCYNDACTKTKWNICTFARKGH